MIVHHIKTRNAQLFAAAWRRMCVDLNGGRTLRANVRTSRGDFIITMGDSYQLAWTTKGRLPQKLPNCWRHQ